MCAFKYYKTSSVVNYLLLTFHTAYKTNYHTQIRMNNNYNLHASPLIRITHRYFGPKICK